MTKKNCKNLFTQLITFLIFFINSTSFVFAHESNEYTIEINNISQQPVVGVQIYGNHNFLTAFTDSDGIHSFNTNDLQRNGSVAPFMLHFALAGYKFEPAELEINKLNCPSRKCRVTATQSTTDESAVVRLIFVGALNRPMSGIKVALGNAAYPCTRSTDSNGIVYFSTKRQANCNSVDSDPLNDPNNIMFTPPAGMQCSFNNYVSAVCPKQSFNSVANQITCSYLPNRTITGYTVRARTKNDLPLAGLVLSVLPVNENYASFNVTTDASGTVLIPFAQLGNENNPAARIIPQGNFDFLPVEINANLDACPKGICQFYANSSFYAQKLHSINIKSANNSAMPGVAVFTKSNNLCNSASVYYTDLTGTVVIPARTTQDCSLSQLSSFSTKQNGCSFFHNNSVTPFKFCSNSNDTKLITAHCDGNISTHQVSGQVLDPYGSPLADVLLMNGEQPLTRSRSDGSYSLSLPHGSNANLSAVFDPLIFDPQQITISAIDRDKKINFIAATAEGGMPDQGGDQECEFSDEYIISGKVLDQAGVALENVSILNNHSQVATSNQNGVYSFSVPAHVDVWVTAEHNDELFNPAGYAFPIISCNKLQTNFQVTNTPSFLQSGVVKDQNDNPVPEFQLNLSVDNQNSNIITDASGYYRVVLAEDAEFIITPADLRYETPVPASHSGISTEDRFNLDFKVSQDLCINTPKSVPGICGCSTADTDNDKDGTPDCIDFCPNDKDKIAAGACGCGSPDTDQDNDGILDCLEECPKDSHKILAGICGCGIPDIDSDADGSLDCDDQCPNDSLKTKPGACGCGNLETDNDKDGTPNCIDLCPSDPLKITPGFCQCGKPETDSDSDGKPDCIDLCPNDPNKSAPGICGCGTSDADSDGDGVLDCHENCPNDPYKTDPGQCGCGTKDLDSDKDGTLDCKEECSLDPNKLKPGLCGCGIPDVDTDQDKKVDCLDECPLDPLKIKVGQCGCGIKDTDSDNDDVPDCIDLCIADPLKSKPGQCGCGNLDTDTDGDGVADCIDECPSNKNKSKVGACGCSDTGEEDHDGDKVIDCKDACPFDANKTKAGICGCGVADTDTDGDGTLDCLEQCKFDPNKIVPGICGCGFADIDSDGDGVLDCQDKCPADPKKQAEGLCGCGKADSDSDQDGVVDCLDKCPADSLKVDIGQCGCGIADVDSDKDGTANCKDECPNDKQKTKSGICGCGISDQDQDNDGIPDCKDQCPTDKSKQEPGICGCGFTETDLDKDGALDCQDSCPLDPLKIAAGACGCGIPDVDTDGDGTPDCIDQCANDRFKIAPGVCGCGNQEFDLNNNGLPDCKEKPIELVAECIAKSDFPEKEVKICHREGNDHKHEIIVAMSALAHHLAHGDTIGDCDDGNPSEPTPTPSASPSPSPQPTPPDQENKKIEICHYPPGNPDKAHTIKISQSAWNAHKAHGDKLGPCANDFSMSASIRWTVKNTNSVGYAANLEILAASPAQVINFDIGKNSTKVINTQVIPGYNVARLASGYMVHAVKIHEMKACPAQKAPIEITPVCIDTIASDNQQLKWNIKNISGKKLQLIADLEQANPAQLQMLTLEIAQTKSIETQQINGSNTLVFYLEGVEVGKQSHPLTICPNPKVAIGGSLKGINGRVLSEKLLKILAKQKPTIELRDMTNKVKHSIALDDNYNWSTTVPLDINVRVVLNLPENLQVTSVPRVIREKAARNSTGFNFAIRKLARFSEQNTRRIKNAN